MPEFLENKLRSQAAKKGKTGRAADRYVFGTMNNLGAMQGNKETEKGREMEAKHKRDTEMKKYHGSASSYKHSRPVRKIIRRSFNA